MFKKRKQKGRMVSVFDINYTYSSVCGNRVKFVPSVRILTTKRMHFGLYINHLQTFIDWVSF